MRCSRCGTDNREGAKFCNKCGTPFGTKCSACGALNEPAAKFCDECGSTLAADFTTDTEVAPSIASSAGERRHLTVLFCDLVGSTEIAAQLDPEEWRDLVAGYHRAAAEAITRYGGQVAKYLGDGVMAYFGWPEAHENDAERAARAGLAILEALANSKQEPTEQKLSVRVGIDSGPVVVGVGAGKDDDIFGETPNIAARVQTGAAPDSVLITSATHRLLSGLFVVEQSDVRQLKGVAAPVELYRVVRPTGVRSRIAVRDLTPFVGRNEELSLLIKRWDHAREGEGQAVLVIGEAGIGKSRLVAEFHDRIRDTPHIWLESAGEQFFGNTPFRAVSEMLSQWLELQGGASIEEHLELLDRALSSAGLKPEDSAPLIADLLQLPVDGRYPKLTLTPEQKRRRLLVALSAWLSGASRLQPVVSVVEDLHWVDPSTLELQQLIVEHGATIPLMLLYTARPEFRTSWPLRAHHTQITLNRLSKRSVREMIAQVAARKALADETVDAVVERTSGVPLFVEELTRAVLETGGAKRSGREIPATLHDSLMARLDRLGSAKEVIQVAAVIGSEFSYGLLHAVHPLAEEDLQRALRNLTNAELVYVRGMTPDATYQFKHALIRDAAYEALLKSRRKELHKLVANIIDEQFHALKEAHPEVLAHHWTEAGEIEPAISGWLRVGKASESRSAFKEAQKDYQQALALTNLLPQSPDRDRRELEFRQSLISILKITKGYAGVETIEAVDNAIPLAEKIGDFAQLVNLLTSRGTTLLVSGDFSGAQAVLDRSLDLSFRQGSASSVAYVHSLQTITRCCSGDLEGAEKHFVAWLAFFTDNRQRSAAVAVNVALNCFAFGGLNAWLQGHADTARQRQVEMLAVAKQGGPFEVANSEYWAALHEIYVRNYERSAELAAHALELAEKHGFPNPAARSRCDLGLAQAYLGNPTKGVALIQQGVAGLREIGTRMGLTAAMSHLAEAHGLEGAIEDALATVEWALEVLPDELSHRPETLRLRGELRLKKGQMKSADDSFREAIALAQRIGARAWELRATMSLARLLAAQGRRDEAHRMLAEIYNWFTEGFNTADLKEAKALLDELGGA